MALYDCKHIRPVIPTSKLSRAFRGMTKKCPTWLASYQGNTYCMYWYTSDTGALLVPDYSEVAAHCHSYQ